MVKPGQLDQQVTFRRRTKTADGGGGFTEAWSDFSTDATVWADVHPLYGKEGMADGGVNASGAWLFHVRNRSDVDEGDQIVWGGEQYNISRVMRRGSREMYLTIEAVRGVAQ